MQLEARMRQQRGLITRAQARSLGMTDNQIAHRARTGEWIRIERGVYRHAAAPLSWSQSAQAAVLATAGVLSHVSVLTALRIDPGTAESIPHVTIEHRRHHRRLHHAVVHSTTQWAAREQRSVRGLPCTGPNRTLLDIGADIDTDALERVAEDMVRRRLTTFPQLARFLALHAGPGRPGSAGLRQMLLRRDPGAALPLSDFSRLVYQLIVTNGLPEPILEHRVFDGQGRFVMQADLAWPDLRCIVELDGLAFHFGRAEVERDRRKRARARAAGWRVMEVLWSMYADEPGELIELLTQFLRPPFD